MSNEIFARITSSSSIQMDGRHTSCFGAFDAGSLGIGNRNRPEPKLVLFENYPIVPGNHLDVVSSLALSHQADGLLGRARLASG